MKICAVTGHRIITTNQINYIQYELHREIELAIVDGFTHFVSGFAEGVDLIFASIVCELKIVYPNIVLEAAIPYRDRLKTQNNQFNELIKKCDHIYIVQEKCTQQCYRARNQYMVDKARRLIAVFNGRHRSGTAQTIRMAEQLNREIRLIEIGA